MSKGIIVGKDGVSRCFWPSDDLEYLAYHDEEWGQPCKDEHRLFEKLCLEGFQAGLSWLTVLRKRKRFRQVFENFDFEKLARYTNKEVEELLLDKGIIRHRKKIESVINNAQRTCELVDKEGSLAKYLWQFEPEKASRPKRFDYKNLIKITETLESKALSKDLKKRGFSFVGPTTMYALMQAMGLVNDHIEGCYCRELIETERQKFKRPT